jgi:hypothetical protein
VSFDAADVSGVSTLRRSIISLLGASLVLAAAAMSPARADAHPPPTVVTGAATSVTTRSAVLQGTVNANEELTSYSFAYGTSASYGTMSPWTSVGKGKTPVPVSYSLAGLTPNTTYHVRLWANSKVGPGAGADVTFTTAAEPVGGATPSPAPAAPAATGPQPTLAPRATPELGRSVNVTVASGTVLVRVPGGASAVPLTGVASVPVGAIVDTRKGTVDLEAALPGARTQTGTFHGGVFQVRQAASGSGMTELALRGPAPTCGHAGARAAATSRRHRARTLWGSDNGGRFRTRGSNSVATVRGTSWFMADRCDGTYTRVKSGSVAVRELRTGRTVVLHAGQSHLVRGRAIAPRAANVVHATSH